MDGQDAQVLWRDIISFSNHDFRKYARFIGSALQVLIKELTLQSLGLGFQNLPGARNQARAALRPTGTPDFGFQPSEWPKRSARRDFCPSGARSAAFQGVPTKSGLEIGPNLISLLQR